MRLLPLAFITTLLSSPAIAEVPKVVTDLPAVQSLAAQVMAGVGTPVILLDKGSDAHHFQLKPSQAKALSQADLVFWIGPEMTPWLERAIEGIGLSGENVELIETEGTHTRMFDEAHHHEGEAEHAEADSDGHMHEGLDPHAWLDPANARLWVGVMADELAKADPEHAATYTENAAAARASIDATEAKVRAILAPVGDAPVVVFHQAYGYFADAFEVNVAGAIALGDAAAPGAARLAAIQQKLTDEGVVCIFPEPQHDPAWVATVVGDSGVRIGAPLDPSGTTLTYGPGLYDALLSGIAQNIADCVTQAR